MSNEVKKFKLEKLELNKRLKEDKLKFEKFKTERYKELMEMKKTNARKDAELRKQTKDMQRIQQLLLRKEEEAEQQKRTNKALKEILEPKKAAVKRGTHNPNSSQEGISSEIVINRMIERLEADICREEEVRKYEQDLHNIHSELNKFAETDCKLQIDYDRQEMEMHCKPEEYEKSLLMEKYNETSGRLREMKEVIEALEEKLDFTQHRLHDAIHNGGGKYNLDTQLLYNPAFGSVDILRGLFRLLVEHHVHALTDKRRISKDNS